ncbi:MAG: hypothetical protein K2N80_05150 [Lachnospiraceae bacterium]|nr:hypothetical protein [Lachnospiraceae bacterium]
MDKKKGKVPVSQSTDGQNESHEDTAKTEMPAEGVEVQERSEAGDNYKITCCNPINDSFGGVIFANGVAHTKNGFTASWFRNKKGYTVSKGEA